MSKFPPVNRLFDILPSSNLGTWATAIGLFFLGEILRRVIARDNIFITAVFAFLSGFCLGLRFGCWYSQQKDKKQQAPTKAECLKAAMARHGLHLELGYPVTEDHRRVCEQCLDKDDALVFLVPNNHETGPVFTYFKLICPTCGKKTN